MIIKHDDNGENGVFFAVENEFSKNAIGEMFYTWITRDTMNITSTHVINEYQGKGVGKLLIAKCVDYARKEGVKIIPTCRYAKVIMERTPEYKDVLN
ncbi:N-acetyltransferase [Bacteroidales bacterium OttesenSCG-928-K03]|nr:N-acetyltransferase [Bacteroidales bacterium OttesenSCG-928-K03]